MKKKSLTDKSGKVRELKKENIRSMRSAKEVLPKKLLDSLPKRKRGERGPQQKPKKVAVTVRYSPEVVEYFKETGEGWQTKINNVLKEWIRKHPH